MARRLGRVDKPPLPMRIQVPAHVAANHEGLVTRVTDAEATGGGGRRWKIVRSFDDPATWTEPLPDQWELYDLDADPIEADNRWHDPAAEPVFDHLARRLAAERAAVVPTRNTPWPYATRTPTGGPMTKTAPPPARALRAALRRLGLHPDDPYAFDVDLDLAGRRALVVATNHGVLDVGKPTGVFASELTVPYYAFLDAGMVVDVASPDGGIIPVDPQSLKPVIRTEADDRFLADDELRAKVTDSLSVASLVPGDYDIVYLAGGWGAAFDLGFSEELGRLVTEANAAGRVIGGVCHGPLGLLRAVDAEGRPLVEGRRVTGVTDKQVKELGITATPHHPETELRRLGAEFESQTRFRDPLANHWVVDGNLVTGQNQNAAPMVAREMLRLVVEAEAKAAVKVDVEVDP
ncbi:MAG: DJ-1/PfpI family protein, partial [Acidimicrobiales bacterium]